MLILFIIVFAAFVMRYRWLPEELGTVRKFDAVLWLSSISISISISISVAGVFRAIRFCSQLNRHCQLLHDVCNDRLTSPPRIVGIGLKDKPVANHT